MNQKKQLHSIQQLSTKLNIPKPTLRYWEKEFEGILQPLRTTGGQRRYTSEHISTIEEIKMLKQAGLSLVDIKEKLSKRLLSIDEDQRSEDLQIDGIDRLAKRVAEVVKMEVLRFLHGAEG